MDLLCPISDRLNPIVLKFLQVVPESGALVQTLSDLDQLAYKQFITVLQSSVQQQLSSSSSSGADGVGVGGVGSSAHDLAPTRSTMALLALMREILSGRNAGHITYTVLRER